MRYFKIIVTISIAILVGTLMGCGSKPVQSVSGIPIAIVGHVDVNTEGHTAEQQNIIDRIKADNQPGQLKHLYVISPVSGQVLIYSPVKGKVTSSGKSLTPKRIDGVANNATRPTIKVGTVEYNISDLPNEDGTFGSTSVEFIYWFTPTGQFHQHFVGAGQIIHVSDQPLAVKGVLITIDK